MRMSHLLLPTERQAPADAEAISHKLLVRAGLIRQLGAGLWSWLPAGWRAHEKAVQIIRETQRASTSSLQRRLRIGYTRAARIMDILEERGIVGPPRGSDAREIMVDLDAESPEAPAEEKVE